MGSPHAGQGSEFHLTMYKMVTALMREGKDDAPFRPYKCENIHDFACEALHGLYASTRTLAKISESDCRIPHPDRDAELWKLLSWASSGLEGMIKATDTFDTLLYDKATECELFKANANATVSFGGVIRGSYVHIAHHFCWRVRNAVSRQLTIVGNQFATKDVNQLLPEELRERAMGQRFTVTSDEDFEASLVCTRLRILRLAWRLPEFKRAHKHPLTISRHNNLVALLRAEAIRLGRPIGPSIEEYTEQACRENYIQELASEGKITLDNGADAEAGTGIKVSVAPTPIWDSACGTLAFSGAKVTFRPIAKNCIAVLNVFQEMGWPDRIDDPVPGGHNDERLRQTVRALNKDKSFPILFEADGTGEGVRWRVRA